MTTKRVVDEAYLKHIRGEVKTIKGLRQKDRLEAWMNSQALMGVIVNHTRSLIVTTSATALLEGLFQDMTDEQFFGIADDLKDLAIHLLKVDKKLTELIPTAIPGQEKQVHAKDFNPLVS